MPTWSDIPRTAGGLDPRQGPFTDRDRDRIEHEARAAELRNARSTEPAELDLPGRG